MKFKLFNLLILVFSLSIAQQIQPTPQKEDFSGKTIATPQSFSYKVVKSAPQSIIYFIESEPIPYDKNGFKIELNKKSKIKNLPNKAEAYYLKIDKNKVTIEARDWRGVYYGLQTFRQLAQNPTLPLGEIIDYPNVEFRGVVEGFYGNPWSFEDRMRQLTFYGENKMNTYIYGPKDDAYHSSPNWRKPYPPEEAQKIKDLVEQAHQNEVDFYWAIHPGKDIRWNAEDRDNLIKKFEAMYALGVRAFAVFFDDISGEGTKADKQAELLNYIDDHFIKTKKDVRPLIMCPTEYNKSWSNIKGGYLPTLGKNLNKDIHIMWTGDRVIGDVTQSSLEWINKNIERKAFFWWNFPVSDYVRDHLLLGPAYGLDTRVESMLSGMVTNPMERAEASKVAIYSVADYAWNVPKYDSIKAWERGIKNVFPTDFEAYKFFAENNADLGRNGHGYRRDESWNYKKLAQKIIKEIDQNNLSTETYQEAKAFFDKMILSAGTLMASQDNPYLIDEIKPWLSQFSLQGQMGLNILAMQQALQADDAQAFLRNYYSAQTDKTAMFYIDHAENQNPYQPGVKTGSLVIQPMLDNAMVSLAKKYNQKYNANLAVQVNYNPHQPDTNIEQLKNQPLVLNNRTLNYSPSLEVVKIKPQGYIGVKLHEPLKVEQIVLNFGVKNFDWGQVQYSENGLEWTPINGNFKDTTWISRPNKKAKFIRFINTSNQEQEMYFKRFELVVK
ncbi:beta-N-acetylglucosaminidase [Ornithobacterium rhinotracheale]|uniref:N-acetyl-beta-hexosaminidase n=1 Tax=Ornithobacterium rhinotracheale (strain ATCC 51463 / DSM 15997 / CCUG 23171 / CIP 104009 / LMG 9086) TaxID=867902 RepID=I3ZYJ0_ORNRL|nr:beta-N-acetylglucosaminidase [Ornithobacterium rhinotracheale]AFL96774.1 N-acetyl-beta-hexosaminidase [Ornithobacterium rhinotracheale DSM 15997]AIP99456.1 hypothetical protein Q785_06875 [Ornithobacterium rhinotracheale ORT-UMN 88]KGB66682.1 hypothetical protein Q787_06690 [Ornithobacterium rhinotracheale H06-030791]MCK0194122.1 beta-N-acetylglucosaminidase domain-containing protein [Ornithobacterium rhinotracheale]MCK0199627.1 beta-N-acetylglucosaminidase domain-containing protein [Ornith